MKAIVYFIIMLISLTFGWAQTSNVKEIKINDLLIGDLYSATVDTKQLAIIIPGSGPTNRNGNSHIGLKGDSYKMLATALVNSGVNTFTYDKRVIALLKSNKVNEKEMNFEQNIEDVNSIINYFKDKYPEIILIGHSEGALVANIVAIENSSVTSFISLQGAGKPADQILFDQITKQAPFFSKQINEIHDKLKKGEIVQNIPPMLNTIYRSDVQPYLISWMKYDPAVEIKKVKQPILIIDGTKDLQVDTEQANLLAKAAPKAKKVTIANMNHVLKKIDKDEDNLKSYQDSSFELHPELITTIVNFINNK